MNMQSLRGLLNFPVDMLAYPGAKSSKPHEQLRQKQNSCQWCHMQKRKGCASRAKTHSQHNLQHLFSSPPFRIGQLTAGRLTAPQGCRSFRAKAVNQDSNGVEPLSGAYALFQEAEPAQCARAAERAREVRGVAEGIAAACHDRPGAGDRPGRLTASR